MRIQNIQARRGAWNVMGKRFLAPGSISSWLFISFDEGASRQPQVAEGFANRLKFNLEKLGTFLSASPVVRSPERASFQASVSVVVLCESCQRCKFV